MGWREPEVSDATAESVWGMQMIRQLMERAVGAFVGRFTVVRRVSDSIHHELGYLPERKMRRLVKQVRRLEEKNYRIKRRCDKEYDRLATLLLKILRKNVGRKIPQAIIIDLKSQGVITDKAIFKYTGYLFDTRRFHEVEEILATSTVTCSIIVDYYRCLLEIYHGDVGFQCRKLKSKSKIGIPEFMKEPIDNLLLEISVREQRTDLVSRALENAYEQRVTQLPPELMLGICRLLIGTDQQHVAKASLDKYQRGKPYEELFYFLEPLRALSSPRVDTMNTWRSVLERLVQTYSAQDSASAAYFKETIAAQLQLVPIGDRDLLDIRFSQSERDQLRALVSRKLAHREPILAGPYW